MDIIKRILSQLDEKEKNNIYLREIALLMEQIEELKEELEIKKNLIKNYEKTVKEK